MTRSEQLYAAAQKVMPGGVSSPVRAFKSVGGSPLYMTAGRGPWIRDADGRDYLDFCGSWGPLVLGHAHPEVKAAMQAVLENGWTFGTPVPGEVELAELLVHQIPVLEKVRFVSSGTEAVMSAVRLARAATGRDAVLKFSGCYHGHADYLLVEGGSGLVTLGNPSSAGVPQAFAALTMNCPLDDEEKLTALFAKEGERLACVLVEGVPANNGLLVQRKEWVHHLRALCDQYGVLLIFDEVLSGFRCPNIMAHEDYAVKPDLITLGKVVGGGMPVGAYGGRAELMDRIAPLGPVYQAGTLSGNPLAMAAGVATLKVLQTGGFKQLDALGKALDTRMQSVLDQSEKVGYVRYGALFWLYFHSAEVPRSAETIHADSAKSYAELFRFMLDCGIYLAPSAYEVAFLNTAQTEAHFDQFADALRAAIQKGILA
ncbi:MAG: glutamate-1-semialdehyde 2,1-aminomutase [Acidobacteria bacterium]|nr:glutamate-1-semialdehyde 2,1-aminomutase [Acidobacteriota bacterium]MCB9398050.1 glutamate-1-semialdehyde 2,1-aminomutase [Acidobacteriota bacterium]